MKQFLSLLLAAVLLCALLVFPAGAAFTDISDGDTALAAAVIQSLGVTDGVGGGRFNPGGTLSRAEFSAFLVRMMGLEDKTSTAATKMLFSDAKPGVWYTGYVNLAYEQGLVQGYGNGTFGPNDSVTYGQVATMLLRLLGYPDAQVGRLWPADFVAFARDLELDEGLSLGAYDAVNRGQTARLLYNTLKTERAGATAPYYIGILDAAATQPAVILDINAENGGVSGQLMVCAVTAAGATVEYYSQERALSAYLVGRVGELLLDRSGTVVGFVPSSDEHRDVVISSAKASGITDEAGITHRISGSAITLVGEELYTWNTTGHIQANTYAGRGARLFYDDSGNVRYVYLAAGTTGVSTDALVAQTHSAASELARRLGITGGYAITKNGAMATAADLTMYDAAYYHSATRTLCASDYKVTGYLDRATPGVDGASSVTVAGGTFQVLESAWSSLSSLSLGDRVTLLLTDDGKVAAVYPASTVKGDMVGLLSLDGKQVTLAGSGAVLTPAQLDSGVKLRGTLVTLDTTVKGEYSCIAYDDPWRGGKLDLAAKTLGSYSLAPGFEVYDQAGAGYLYSLEGEQGVPSIDFDQVDWTTSLPGTSVKTYHRNTAGQVDLLVLASVTGNCYAYGDVDVLTGSKGVSMGVFGGLPTWNTAATLTNGNGTSAKYLYPQEGHTGSYAGISLYTNSVSHQGVADLTTLTGAKTAGAGDFFLEDGDWYATVNGYEMPVSGAVQVYFSATEGWQAGEPGLVAALSAEHTLWVYYDHTPATGGQVRVISVR